MGLTSIGDLTGDSVVLMVVADVCVCVCVEGLWLEDCHVSLVERWHRINGLV